MAALCLCCFAVFGVSAVAVATQQDDTTLVIDAFMQAMEKKDFEQASTLFSTRAERETLRSNLEETADGVNYALFDGYEDVTVLSLNIGPTLNTNPDVPQGLVARVNGSVAYEGGFGGTFEAVLVRESGEWRLYNINVVASPNKFEDFTNPVD